MVHDESSQGDGFHHRFPCTTDRNAQEGCNQLERFQVAILDQFLSGLKDEIDNKISEPSLVPKPQEN